MFLNNIFQKFDHPPHLEKIPQVDAPPNFYCFYQKWIPPPLNNNFHVINQKGFFFVVVIAAVLRVCVYAHAPQSLHLLRTSGTAREQINDVLLKTLDSFAGFLHLYFGMQSLTFQLTALSCSYIRSGHSHDLTSIRVADLLWSDLLLRQHSREGSQSI